MSTDECNASANTWGFKKDYLTHLYVSLDLYGHVQLYPEISTACLDQSTDFRVQLSKIICVSRSLWTCAVIPGDINCMSESVN